MNIQELRNTLVGKTVTQVDVDSEQEIKEVTLTLDDGNTLLLSSYGSDDWPEERGISTHKNFTKS